MKRKYTHIFGPVPSRRLGYSLGVDLIPFKTCTYDCIYCQLGKTTNNTIVRKEYYPVDEICREIHDKLKENVKIDYVTLSGSGEPTLYSRIDEIIGYIKSKTQTPVAVLTNGSLLYEKNVQNQIKTADLVVPSLDAPDENLFNYVNRPNADLNFIKIIQGLIEFRKVYVGKIWLEIFLLDGVTSIQAEIEKLADIAAEINPDKIQLNTVARPTAESYACPVSKDHMLELKKCFKGNVEIIADFNKIHDAAFFQSGKNEIINLLKRRPCSVEDIQSGLNMHKNEVLKYIEDLVKENIINSKVQNDKKYYYLSCK